ncbi:MAG TPA: glutamate 5-kinase [Actinomycetaceae bacterium]|nr:glutamate 5-kinase [Actinomycetaceae bacterium]
MSPAVSAVPAVTRHARPFNPIIERTDIVRARRFVVKVGSSSLTVPDDGLDVEYVDHLVDVLAARRKRGDQVVLVSSGSIAAGMPSLGRTSRPTDLATLQATASVGQGLLLQHYTSSFARYGITVGQVLLTAEDLMRPQHYRNALRTMERMLEMGVVPIVNENDVVATHEIRFGDNDRLAALVANLVRAQVLVLLTDVDGLYTAPPSQPGARLVPFVSSEKELADYCVTSDGSTLGTGGMATKLDAALIATHSGVPVLLAHADKAEAALRDGRVGTWFAVSDHRRSNKRLWLAWVARTSGRIVLDDGAAYAILDGKRSLLAAGIVAADGEFEAGDPVDILDREGRVIARGLTGYSRSDVVKMAGKSTVRLRVEMGDAYARPVVHRDDLAPRHLTAK